MVTLGRWSYGLFVWHLAALTMAFPAVGRFVFSGDMVVILVLTLIFGFAMAAVSYALVEQPCRQALRNWERSRRAARPGQFVTDTPSPPSRCSSGTAEAASSASEISANSCTHMLLPA